MSAAMPKRRVWIPLLCVLALLLLTTPRLATPSPATAQDTAQDTPGWALMLLDAEQRQLITVTLDGQAERQPLPVAGNTFVGPGDLIVSPNGERVAFAAFTYNNDGTATQTLAVQSLANAEVLVERDFANIEDFRVSAFDASGERVVVGVVNRLFEGQADAASPDGPLWSLLVLDAATGETVARLDSDNDAVQTLPGRLPDIAYMPLAVDVTGTVLAISQVPWIGAGIDETFGFTWDFDADTVQDAPRFASSVLSRQPATGEVAQIALDTDAPLPDTAMPLTPFNAVDVLQDGAARTVFRSADSIVLDVQFIANGARLAIHLLQGDREPQQSKWVVLDRDGTVRDLTPYAANVFVEVRPAPNGFVALRTTYPQDFTAAPDVVLTFEGDGQPVTLWEGTGDFYNIVWNAPHPYDTAPPFPPVAAAED